MHTSTTEAEEKRYAELQGMALDFARRGDEVTLSAMVQHGLPVNLADHRGNTLLMLACYYGNYSVAEMLLKHGADVDRRNQRGQTPLGGAAFKGFSDIVELLLRNNASLEADNGAGMTPLMFAAMFGRSDTAKILAEHGASMKRRSRFGVSAKWMLAISSIVRAVVDRKRRKAVRFVPGR